VCPAGLDRVAPLASSSGAPTPLYQGVSGFPAIAATHHLAAHPVAVLTALLTVTSLSDQLGRRPVILVPLLMQAAVFVTLGIADSRCPRKGADDESARGGEAMTSPEPIPTTVESVVQRIARSYVPTTGPARPTLRQRWIRRRPSRPLPGVPATLGRRLAARLVDSAVALVAAAGLVYLAATGAICGLPRGDDVEGVSFLVFLFGYEFLTVAVFGRTLGKWIMELRVVHVDGYGATWWSAGLRAFLPCWLNIVTCGICGTWCYLSPIMDDDGWQRGWHDRIARTVVTYQPDRSR
jgi:uncharacterized RDD family membrane protein YckC